MEYLFLTGSMNAGGAERQLFNLLANFPSTNITLFSFSISDHYRRLLTSKSIEFYELSFANPLSLFRLFVFAYHLSSPAIIQGWLAKGNCLALILNFLFPSKFSSIFLGHRSLVDLNQSLLSNLLIRVVIFFSHFKPRSITHICNSEVSLINYKHFCSKHSKFLYIPNGYFFPETSIIFSSRSSSNLLPLRLLVVSRFSPEKGLTNIIDALKLCVYSPNIHVTFIGNNVKCLFNLLGDVRFSWSLYDSVDNLSDYYFLSHFLVHFPFSESSSNVVSEALLHGLPVISNNTGDTRLVVGDGGFIADSFSIAEYTHLITQSFECYKKATSYIDLCSKAVQRRSRFCSFSEMSYNYYLAYSTASLT